MPVAAPQRARAPLARESEVRGSRALIYNGAMTRHLAPALALALTVAACGFPKTADAPPPLSAGDASAAAARWPGATAESIAHGRELFVAKCNGCHGYPDLASLDASRWPPVVERMAAKSDLAAKDRDDVLHFVLTARERPGGAPKR